MPVGVAETYVTTAPDSLRSDIARSDFSETRIERFDAYSHDGRPVDLVDIHIATWHRRDLRVDRSMPFVDSREEFVTHAFGIETRCSFKPLLLI